MAESSKSSRILYFLSSSFEYYDFIIYGLMSSYIAMLFFPNDNQVLGQLKAISIFAIGYVARPLGAMLWGFFGDLKGKRKAFINSNIFLGISTIGISVLPDYKQLGVIATILLVVFRVIQAASFAAELPGSVTMISAEGKSISSKFSFVIVGASIGSLMATLALFLLEMNFSNEEILGFAWRIPFIFGSILCFISMILRRKLPKVKETNSKNNQELVKSIFPQINNIISLIFIVAVPAFLIIMNIFFPVYLTKFYKYDSKQVFLAITFSYFIAAINPIIFGVYLRKLEDQFEKITSITRIILFSTMVIGLVLNFLLLRGGFVKLLLVLSIYQILITSLMILIFIIMAKIFPPQASFSLIGITYNVTYLFISFSPILVNNLSQLFASPVVLWFLLIILCLFALSNLNKLKVIKA